MRRLSDGRPLATAPTTRERRALRLAFLLVVLVLLSRQTTQTQATGAHSGTTVHARSDALRTDVPAPSDRPAKSGSPAQLRQRQTRIAVETVCRELARAVVRRTLPDVHRRYPDADLAHWTTFFDTYEILAYWPVNDVRVESRTRASCAFTIDVAERRRATRLWYLDDQSFPRESAVTVSAHRIRYSVRLAATGATWLVTSVTGVE